MLPLHSEAANVDPELGHPDSPAASSERSADRKSRDLYHQINSIDGHNVKKIAVLSFRALQLYRIGKLQDELLKKQSEVMGAAQCMKASDQIKSDNDSDVLIQKYADAIRNYETLSQVIVHKENVEYEILGNEGFQVVKRKHTTNWMLKQPAENTIKTTTEYGKMGFRELDQRRTRERELLARFYSRFHMALFGGVSILAPVSLMALHRGLSTTLITTAVSTILFAIIVTAFSTEATGKDVLASTAAYAAVLVVFVGTSLQDMVS